MKATLRSVRIAPKKAGLIAKMVRGKPVQEALTMLERTNKKGARLLLNLVRSAMANASHNDKQKPGEMIIKSLIVNKAQSYYRAYPIARGRQRSYHNFLSHITVQLGYMEPASDTNDVGGIPQQTASQSARKTVKKGSSSVPKTKRSSSTSSSSS